MTDRRIIDRARDEYDLDIDLSVVKRKRCARCGEVKPADAFRPNPRLKSGLSSWCRPCRSEYARAWKAAHRAPLFREARTCSECGLPFTARNPTALVCSSECRRRRKARVALTRRARRPNLRPELSAEARRRMATGGRKGGEAKAARSTAA